MIHRQIASLTLLLVVCQDAAAQPLVYLPAEGPGEGRHIVWLIGDHEYRSEEAVPALARILAQRHGFKCTLLFTRNPQTGFIDPAADNLPGTERLQDADLMFVFLRFKNLPVEQMQPIVDYLDRGGPVIGVRTATHAFKIPADSPFARFDYMYPGDEFLKGFGRQVLGETWAGHYGTNGVMSTRLIPTDTDHPVLRGVDTMWVPTGAYWAEPMPDSQVLVTAQPLQGMAPDSPPIDEKPPCPAAWVRTYRMNHEPGSPAGRVFTTTSGAAVDLRSDSFRRLLVNACFWACSLEDQITESLDINFVGPYDPSESAMGG